MNKEIPIYKIVVSDLDEKQGVNKISLVETPAIEENWMYFKKEENPYFLIKNLIFFFQS